MLWSSMGRFGVVGIHFISNMVLARLLTPKEFGCIGMLQIFIAVSEVFIIGGFGAALIQKKNPTHIDYTTVFYWNLMMAIVIYGILYYSAPFIARFYDIDILCNVLRVQSLTLIIGSFSIVQSNQLQKQLRFKEYSIRGILAASIGVSVSITMAFMEYGIWSLVGLTLATSISNVILLWGMSKWRPTLEFSFQSLRTLFAFGGLMALSSFVEKVYTNIQGLIIGKYFTPQDLGYYSQARKLEQIPTSALSSVVGQVAFPVFSLMNDDKAKLRKGVSKSIKSISFISIPLCTLLIVIAKPIIRLLYGPQWDESIPYFQILCFSGMIYIINGINLNLIKALGKGKVYFIMQTTKRLTGLSLIITGISFGVIGVVCSVAVTFYIDFLINGFVNKKLIGYGVKQQILDIWKTLALAGSIGIATFLLVYLIPLNSFIVMFIQIPIFVVLYLYLSQLLQIDGANVYKEVITNFLGKRYGKQ